MPRISDARRARSRRSLPPGHRLWCEEQVAAEVQEEFPLERLLLRQTLFFAAIPQPGANSPCRQSQADSLPAIPGLDAASKCAPLSHTLAKPLLCESIFHST